MQAKLQGKLKMQHNNELPVVLLLFADTVVPYSLSLTIAPFTEVVID